MKIKDGFVIRKIAGELVIVPVGPRVVELNGIISLNATGELLWKVLQEDVDLQTLINALTAEFNVDEATAKEDIDDFIAKLSERNLLE